MRSIIAVLLFVVAAANAVSFSDIVITEEWQAFKLEHDKKYENKFEEHLRMKIFASNKARIARHNQRYEQGLETYKLAVNMFADMLHYEFVQIMTGLNVTVEKDLTDSKSRGAAFIPPAHVEFPALVDWRNKGAVTAVKNQGRCGSCWAFSTTGVLEGQHYRKAGYLVSLSEQNLIDCSTPYGNSGCNGGSMIRSYLYIKDNGGIDTEKSYPYKGVDGTCRFNRANVGATDVGYVLVDQGDEEKLVQAVATVGPLSVAIDASPDAFQFYSHGVYYEKSCSSTKLNHGVLVVGYGTDENGGDYWLVKNSWGTSWGDHGYIKMARNRRNNCGIASLATYPLV